VFAIVVVYLSRQTRLVGQTHHTVCPMAHDKRNEQAARGSAEEPRQGPRPGEAVAELQHRVRNVLAVVRSIARRTAATSRDVEEYAMNFDGRLNAYSRTLSLLTQGSAAGVELEFLLAEELLSVQARDEEQVTIAGPRVNLRPGAAETIGLAIHELTTNAVKHGALSQNGGKIAVTWQVEHSPTGDELVFDWRESGGRRLVPVRTRRGFGVEMLEETLPFELQARTELEFGSTGFRCRIRFPIHDQVMTL
jgi:two-component system, chemotaxis family, CheB/CheR fusion protein